MPEASHIEPLLGSLQLHYGSGLHFGRSKRLFRFSNHFTCSINYSTELRGAKFFYGLSQEVLDRDSELPATNYGHFVLLICGHEQAVLWLPRTLVLNAMAGVSSRKLDVFLERSRYILQTTGHPKLDVTGYLNISPPIPGIRQEPQSLPTLGRIHSEIQLGLAKIGRAEGCEVWVPLSDRNLSWKEETLRDFTCAKLPRFGFDENTRRVVSNIDVLWLRGNLIQQAFEIEATTSIYSGLLRLNDLALAQPNNRMQLSLVADASREPRVLGQMMRPTFRKLSDRCSFLGFDVVKDSLEEVERLAGRGVVRIEGLLKAKPLRAPEEQLLDPIDLQL